MNRKPAPTEKLGGDWQTSWVQMGSSFGDEAEARLIWPAEINSLEAMMTGRIIAQVYHSSSGRKDTTCEARAKMMTAAPALIKALADMLAGWQYIRDQHGDLPGVGWDRAQEAAIAALKKSGALSEA